MARIRSVHPGLFTDEAFMSCGFAARQLIVGLWCEARDDGVFEWKTLTLKARIFPVDNIDVEELLAELESHDIIRRFEAGGKSYGAVRNFRKYQRPKKPNDSGVLPDEFRTYVGLSEGGSEPEDDKARSVPKKEEPAPDKTAEVPNQFRTSSELVEHMEDGGGRKKEEKKYHRPEGDPLASSDPPDKPDPAEAQFREFWENYPHPPNRGSKQKAKSRFTRMPDADREAILGSLRGYRDYCEAAKSWYQSKMAEGFLNPTDRRWESVPDANAERARRHSKPPDVVDMSKWGRSAG